MVIKIKEVDRNKVKDNSPVFIRAILKRNTIIVVKGFHIYLLKDDKVYVSQNEEEKYINSKV